MKLSNRLQNRKMVTVDNCDLCFDHIVYNPDTVCTQVCMHSLTIRNSTCNTDLYNLCFTYLVKVDGLYLNRSLLTSHYSNTSLRAAVILKAFITGLLSSNSACLRHMEKMTVTWG